MSWQTVVESSVKALGYEFVEVERTPGGLLRVYIDRLAGDPKGEFIVVEDCERVTRHLQHVLEVENCAYQRLEVSSPGLDRALKKAADYERFEGQRVNLTLKLALKGRKRYRGTLQRQPQGGGWRLLLDDEEAPPRAGHKLASKPLPAAAQALDFQLEEVREARLVPELDFKGRRFLPAAQDAPAGCAPGAGVDGGGEQ